MQIKNDLLLTQRFNWPKTP